jgi:hypothetical protein
MVFRAPISSVGLEVVNARRCYFPLELNSGNSLLFDFNKGGTFNFRVLNSGLNSNFSISKFGNSILIRDINPLWPDELGFNIFEGVHEWKGLIIERDNNEVSVRLQPLELSPQSIPYVRQPMQTLHGLDPIREFNVESDEPLPASVPEGEGTNDINGINGTNDINGPNITNKNRII